MKKIGIIVEYNPFHNGHKYHLDNAKNKKNLVIAVMSGDFVQRGEPAFLNKWSRAESSLFEGIDILVELPVFYSTQSAEIFARGAIGILNYLEVDEILFGSESSDITKLNKIIDLEKSETFIKNLKNNLKKGLSYPTAYNNEIKNQLGNNFNLSSNDILGLEYLRALVFWKSNIIPKTLQRKEVDYHSEKLSNGFASASGIRKIINQNKNLNFLNSFIPEKSKEIILDAITNGKTTDISKFYPLIKYAILSQKENLENIQDIEDGFQNRLYEKALITENYKDFIENIMTKRYTIGRIQRILIHILLGITKEITYKIKQEIPFVHVLGFSEEGQKYLKILKNKEKFKIISSLKNVTKILTDEERELLELNERASEIYRIVNPYKKRKIPFMYKKIK